MCGHAAYTQRGISIPSTRDRDVACKRLELVEHPFCRLVCRSVPPRHLCSVRSFARRPTTGASPFGGSTGSSSGWIAAES